MGRLKVNSTLLWFVAVVATFAGMGAMSIHVGDDMGYLFTDSVHHNCDGHAVQSLGDIINTQVNHWHTTNGRFAVHTVVMAMLNLVPLWAYRTINALMFGLLWLLMVNLAKPASDKKPSAMLCALTWCALWVLLPQPVLLFTTLVAYAVNYLWVSVAMLAFLLLLQKGTKTGWLCSAAFAVATLHEGASLPVLCGLLLACVWQRRVSPWVLISFALGSALCTFAPGNLAHAAQGASIMLKIKALAQHLSHSVITLSLIILVIMALIDRRSTWAFVRQNIVMVTAIAASLAMAALTFTAPRQLMMPSIFATTLLLKAIAGQRMRFKRPVAIVATITTLSVISAATEARRHVYGKYTNLMHHVANGDIIAYPHGSDTTAWLDRTTSDLLVAYAPDPLLNRGISAIGDRYTMQGLRRTINPAVTTILPYDKQFIISAIDTTYAPTVTSDTTKINIQTQPLGPFSVTVIPTDSALTLGEKLSPRVAFTHARHKYYITPPRPTTTFKKQ